MQALQERVRYAGEKGVQLRRAAAKRERVLKLHALIALGRYVWRTHHREEQLVTAYAHAMKVTIYLGFRVLGFRV